LSLCFLCRSLLSQGWTGRLAGLLSAPVAKTIAPTAIALASIAITFVFIFQASLAHELDLFNRLVTGPSHVVHQARSKAPVTQRPFAQNLLMGKHI
jgi:hypothetical protein